MTASDGRSRLASFCRASCDVLLNAGALNRCEILLAESKACRVRLATTVHGTRLVDCGVQAAGGMTAGIRLAEICLAGMAAVAVESDAEGRPQVVVRTDQPVPACLGGQYAGWQISGLGDSEAGKEYFAMGSGPMRVAAAVEPLIDELQLRESPAAVVGVLEAAALPPDDVCLAIAERCGVPAGDLTLLVAPTASQAGNLQIVARSVETALHKLHTLEFPLGSLRSGWGVAPLPPVAADDLQGIGRTNDAILYGARVSLWYDGEDAWAETLGPQVPSSASSDYGQPFLEIFRRYNNDFYQIDAALFSPAEIRLINLRSGRSFLFGRCRPDLLEQSLNL